MKPKNSERRNTRFWMLILALICGMAFFAFYVVSGSLIRDGLMMIKRDTHVQGISADFTCLSVLNVKNINQMQKLEEYAASGQIQFSPDGLSLALFDNDLGVHLLDLTSKKRMYFQQQLSTAQDRGQEQPAFVFSPDSRFIVTYSSSNQNEGGLKIWDIQSASLVRIVEEGTSVYAAAMSPDSRYIAFTIQNGTLKAQIYWLDLHQQESKKQFISISNQTGLSFNPINSSELLFNTPEGLATFNIQSQTLASNRAVRIHRRMTLSLDAQFLLTWDFDAGIDLWDLETGAHTLDVMASPPWNLVALNHNKTVLAYSSNNYLTLVDIKTGYNILQFPASSQSGADMSLHPTEPLIASITSAEMLQIWDYSTGKQVFNSPNSGTDLLVPTWQFPQAQFNPQGTLLVVSSDPGIEIWGVKDPNCAA